MDTLPVGQSANIKMATVSKVRQQKRLSSHLQSAVKMFAGVWFWSKRLELL